MLKKKITETEGCPGGWQVLWRQPRTSLKAQLTSRCLNENKWVLRSRVRNAYNVLSAATEPPQIPKLRKEVPEESTAMLSIMLMYRVWMHTCYSACVEVRGQLAEVGGGRAVHHEHLTSAYGAVLSSSPPGDSFLHRTFSNVWRHFWLSQLRKCYQHAIDRSQGCCQTSL